MMRREIADLVDTVKRAKGRDKACTLLIGAGCSVKAGIPIAGEFIEVIRKEFPRAYARATQKTYPHLMAQLSSAERRDLIVEYINKARLNWAHLAIAQLIKHGYVDRVLTVNFDPLIMRACALVGVFPAVYDFAASQNFKPDFIAEQSVFYLHGQHTGFVLLNTESEVRRFSQLLEPVFLDSCRGRVWIVAGYSGENDPVFDHLARIERYDNGLYWICYKDEAPKQHIQDKLLVESKDCFYIPGFDADDFFVALAQGLDCFPPDFVQTPFTHLKNLLEPVLPYSSPGNDSSLEAIPKKLLGDAIEAIEKPAALVLRARDLLLKGDHSSVIAMEKDLKGTPSTELEDLIAWGYISAGNQALAEAGTKSGEEADLFWAESVEKYKAALRIRPDHPYAHYNWGNALDAQARTKSGEEAERLWAEAIEKYKTALEKKPDNHYALYNWGNVLDDQARMKSGEEADRLWAEAMEKFEAALKIKPDYDVLNNWGLILTTQARKKSGEQADRLSQQAIEKYEAALKIRQDRHETFYNWAITLGNQSRKKSGEEADQLRTQAIEKYKQALKIKPDNDEALNNWGNILSDQARLKSGEEADQLWAQAIEKYEAVLKLKPDNEHVLNNWGIALRDQAATKNGEEAEQLLKLADEKFAAAKAQGEES